MHAHRCDVCSKLQFAKNIFAIRSMPPQVTIFPTYRPPSQFPHSMKFTASGYFNVWK